MKHQEIAVFWRLPNGLRCVAVQHEGQWQLRVVHGNEIVSREQVANGRLLLKRARELKSEMMNN